MKRFVLHVQMFPWRMKGDGEEIQKGLKKKEGALESEVRK